jgi:iron complex transport system substrate-binding protein
MKRIVVAIAVLLSTTMSGAQPREPDKSTLRVVAIGGPVTEIVFALGAGRRLVAADTTSVYPVAAKKLPSVGYMRAVSSEGVLSVKPQLVLVVDDAGPGSALAQIRSTGVPVTILPKENSYESLLKSIRIAATALGMPAEGRSLEKQIAMEWAKTETEVKAYKQRPRVLFLLAHSSANSMLVAGEDTSADAMIRLAGGTNAASGFKGYKPLSAEAAIAAAPEVLLITSEGVDVIGGAERLWERPGLAQTPAAKEKRVVAFDSLYLLGFGPRLPEAVRDLARRVRGL